MNISTYLDELVKKGTWSLLSSESHSIFLFILVKSQGSFTKITYSQYVSSTGVSKGSIKKKLTELEKNNLITFNENKEVKPVANLEYSDSSLPLPPINQEEGESDLFTWVQEMLSSTFGSMLTGVLIGYIIKLWLDYLEEKNDPLSGWLTFSKEDPFEKYGLTKLETLSQQKLNKPISSLTPTDFENLFNNEN